MTLTISPTSCRDRRICSSLSLSSSALSLVSSSELSSLSLVWAEGTGAAFEEPDEEEEEEATIAAGAEAVAAEDDEEGDSPVPSIASSLARRLTASPAG